MADALTLEPYAAELRWSCRQPAAGSDWQEFLADFAGSVARRAVEAGFPLVGHLKGVALVPGGGYLRVSVVSAERGPSVEGSLPDGLTELDLTLNVVAYGLPRECVAWWVQEEAAGRRPRWACRISVGARSPQEAAAAAGR